MDGHPAQVADEAVSVEKVLKDSGALEVVVAKDAAEKTRIWEARRVAIPALARCRPTLMLEDATVPRSKIPAMLEALDKIAATAGNSLEPYFSLEIPALMNTLSAVVTAFVLGLCMSSLRGKIKRVQARLADLDKLQAAAQQPDSTTKFDGGEIVRNAEENRLQILFDEIPDADTRDALKSNGFRWSPRNKAWQRQLTQNAEYAARRVLGL